MAQMTDNEILTLAHELDMQDSKPGDVCIQPIDFARALLAKAVPDGYVVVPKEPTDEMLTVGSIAVTLNSYSPRAVYAAMISAAPSAEGE